MASFPQFLSRRIARATETAACALLSSMVLGCESQAPVEGGIYELVSIDSTALPYANVASALLSLEADHTFTRTERDTVGGVLVEAGTWFAAGPFEMDGTNMEFTLDDSSERWPGRAQSDLLQLRRKEHQEIYRSQ